MSEIAHTHTHMHTHSRRSPNPHPPTHTHAHARTHRRCDTSYGNNHKVGQHVCMRTWKRSKVREGISIGSPPLSWLCVYRVQ